MTFGNMQTELKSRLSVEGGSAFWTAADIKRWLNLAQIWVTKQKPWRITMTAKDTTTTSSKYYDLPSNYLYGSAFWLKVNSKNHFWVDNKTFFDEDFNTNYRFTILGKWFFVYPTPSASGQDIEYWYQKRLEDMSADADVSALQDELHDAIIGRAEWTAWKRAKERGFALSALADAKDIIDDVWELDKRSFRGAKEVKDIQDNYPDYTASGLTS